MLFKSTYMEEGKKKLCYKTAYLKSFLKNLAVLLSIHFYVIKKTITNLVTLF